MEGRNRALQIVYNNMLLQDEFKPVFQIFEASFFVRRSITIKCYI